AGRWVLLLSDTATVLADLEALTAKALSSAPEMHARYAAWSATATSDGAVLAGATAGDALQLQRSADFGATWTAVGDPMAKGQDFGLGAWLLPVERQGTVMTLSMTTGYGHY